MVHVLVWAGVIFGIVLWSSTAWAFHALGAWSLAQADALSIGTLTVWRLPPWLALWIPPDLQTAVAAWLEAMAPAFAAFLDWAPNLTDEFTTVVWSAWGVGAVLLVVLGMLLSGLISVMRRSSRRRGASPKPRAAVAGHDLDLPPTWTSR